MRHVLLRQSCCLATLVLGVTVVPALSAATAPRYVLQMGSGICQANNPANEAQLRYLPGGLRNTGSANVSIVCSLWGDDYAPTAATSAIVFIRNDRTTAYSVTCTLHHGTPAASNVVVITKSATIDPGTYAVISWNVVDYGTGVNQQWVNLQCSLPQGFSIQEIGSSFTQEVGN